MRVRLVECPACHAVFTDSVSRKVCPACDHATDTEGVFYRILGSVELGRVTL